MLVQIAAIAAAAILSVWLHVPTTAAQEQLQDPAEQSRQARLEAFKEATERLQKQLREVDTARRAVAARPAPQPRAAAPRAAAAPWGEGWASSTEEDEEGRIVNGTRTVRYPTTGALLKGDSAEDASSWCTGTLVGCNTFLTANHCVRDDRDPTHYFVYLQHGGKFRVKSVSHEHPDFKFPFADLAVITLGSQAEGITPSNIYAGSALARGTGARIVGFGRSGGGNLDYGLKRTGTVETSACDRDERGLICWDFTGPTPTPGVNSNTCNADSGGPLFFKPGNNGRLLVAGVTSGGSKDSCLVGDHSYDVDVRQFAQWIRDNASETLGPADCGPLPAYGTDGVRSMSQTAILSPGESKLYRFSVPARTSVLRVALNGEDLEDPATNLDLFVQHGSAPAAGHGDCVRNGHSNYEFCEVRNDTSGDWFARVAQNGTTQGRFQLVATIINAP
jgi:V8-like Glu-specific endopeptidase